MTPEKKLKIILKSAGKNLNTKWKNYLDITSGEFTETKNQIGIVQNLVSKTPDNVKSVLVVGAGDGTELELIQDTGRKAYGIHISPSEVKYSRNKGLKSYLMDMHEITFRKKFDMVYCKDAFKQAMSPIIVWNEFVRVAKKYILISEPDERWAMRPHNFLLLTYNQFEIMASKSNWEIADYWELRLPFVNQRNFLFKKCK